MGGSGQKASGRCHMADAHGGNIWGRDMGRGGVPPVFRPFTACLTSADPRGIVGGPPVNPAILGGIRRWQGHETLPTTRMNTCES